MVWDYAPSGADLISTTYIDIGWGSAGTLIVDGGSDARYLPSGHLVYAVSGTLFAVAFDAERLTPRGNRVAVVEGVRRVGASGASPGVAQYAVSANGMLAYIAGPVSAWIARQGLGIGDQFRCNTGAPSPAARSARRETSSARTGSRISRSTPRW